MARGSAEPPTETWSGWFFRKASRETTTGEFIPVIDGLRFIAIFSVILYHVYTFVSRKNAPEVDADPLARVLMTGDVGVQLFFIISGFIIALPFAKGCMGKGNRPRLRSYYLRRLTRLEPPYILSLLFLFPLTASIIHLSYRELFPHLLASLGYLHSLIYGQMSAVNFVAWSLEVELQFYLLAPLATTVFLIRSKAARRTMLLMLIAFFSLIAYEAGTETNRLTLSILVSAQYFLTGFLLVDVYLCEWRDGIPMSSKWDVVSILSWIAIFFLHWFGRQGNLWLVIPMFLAYYSAFRGLWSNRFFTKPAIFIIGGICYTLYLYHYTVIFIVGRLLERAGLFADTTPWMQMVVVGSLGVPAVLFFGTLLFVLIEKPCMRKDWHVRVLGRIKEWGRSESAAAPNE